ncbi:MAG: hypothetical protein RR595_11280 [Lysinibacillus sp.]
MPLRVGKELSSSPDGILAYRTRFKQVMDEEATVREAELREKVALEQGVELDAREANEKTACNLLKMNMDIQVIAKATGLSREHIEELRDKMNLF